MIAVVPSRDAVSVAQSSPVQESVWSDESASVPVLGDVLMVAVAVVAAMLVITLALGFVDVLPEDERPVAVEFSYTDEADPAVADSFDTTNEEDEYDGLLTIVFTHGEPVPASELSVQGPASHEEVTSWADAGIVDVPSETVGAGAELRVWVREDDTVRVFRDEDEQTGLVGVWRGS